MSSHDSNNEKSQGDVITQAEHQHVADVVAGDGSTAKAEGAKEKTVHNASSLPSRLHREATETEPRG